MPTQRQIQTNRRNAQPSTGPRIPQGRAAVRLKAIQHGLTARQAVIQTESEDEFNALLHSFETELAPRGPLEIGLVHRIVAAHWRLHRTRQVETDILDLRLDYLKDELEQIVESARPAQVVFKDIQGPDAIGISRRMKPESSALSTVPSTSCSASRPPGPARTSPLPSPATST